MTLNIRSIYFGLIFRFVDTYTQINPRYINETFRGSVTPKTLRNCHQVLGMRNNQFYNMHMIMMKTITVFHGAVGQSFYVTWCNFITFYPFHDSFCDFRIYCIIGNRLFSHLSAVKIFLHNKNWQNRWPSSCFNFSHFSK